MKPPSVKDFEYYKKSSAKGVKWTGAGEVISRLFQFIVSVALARLLTPVDFGLIALALIITKLIQLIIDFGFSSTIIQRPEINKEHYNTTFVVVLFFAILIFLFLFFNSSLIASWLGNKEISGLIKYLSPVVLLSAINVVPRARLTRKLNFRRIAAAEFISTIFYGGITVVFAFLLRNVWCFVIGILTEQIVLGILLWIFSNYRPSFSLSFRALREMFNFSGAVFGTRLLNFANLNALNILIQKFYGSYSLGLFSLAYQIIDLPTQRIAKNIMKVMYPILSRLQTQSQEYKKLFLTVLYIMMLIILPLFIVLYLLAEPFVMIFFGEKWMAAVPFLKIVCVVGIIRSLWTVISAVSMSIGRPQLELILNLLNIILLVAGIFIIEPYGLTAILIYFTFLLSVLYVAGQFWIFKVLQISPWKILRQVKIPLFANGLLFSILYFFSRWEIISSLSPLLMKFVLLSIVAVLIYLIILWIMDRRSLINLFKMVIQA
ncbi:MAG: lipopolysaccharide biosynthesis protein [Calditrichia bacterium]